MRRPNLKWILKTACLVVTSGTLFLVITSWISASPYTNKPVHHGISGGAQPQPQPLPHPQPQPLGEPQRLKQHEQDSNEIDSQKKRAQKIEKLLEGITKPTAAQPSPIEHEQVGQEQILPPSAEKKDWHDYTSMEHDAKRIGIGEQGKAAKLDESQKELERKMSLQNGFNALLSDSISVNRSLPDIRHKDCQKQHYLAKLPTVSVIIIFWNEYFSVLMRSIHSLVNRSPHELLKEIILVDDHSDSSDRPYLFTQLENYIDENFPKLVKIVRLPSRTGLIGARVAGARAATAEVLIFLDSHIEANYNWLPPLLEPIAQNKRTAVCPFIDVIAHDTFNYRSQDEGARGAFDWEFYYKRLPLLPEDLQHPAKPFKSPVMAGGLFAISTEFFWEIGGYDEGLDIWGGEQYELSFKIWMCGGEMYDAPCSRVGHIYRGPRTHVPSPRHGDYLHKNYKRVAEVWMDEYKNYLYEHGDGIYETVDAGDLTEQKAIREKLQCKSFKWFMEEVAFDLVKTYPPVEPPDYATGAIQNVGDPSKCVDTLGRARHSKMGVYYCADNLQRPQHNQFWSLSWHRDLRQRHKKDCLDVQQWQEDASVWLWDCHGQGGNQFWFYNVEAKHLIHGKDQRRCLEYKPVANELVVNKCNMENRYMKWNFGNVNTTALKTFFHEDR